MPHRSRLARLLQFTCGLQLGVAGAWLAGWWAASPAWALAGAILVLGIAPLILGIELLIVARVARTDRATPRPRAGQLLRAWISESAHWYRTFCWRQPFRWRAEDDTLADGRGRQGVVLVHGFMCNRGFWTPWLRRLRAAGHACEAVNLEPVFTGIDDYATLLEAAVARVRAATGRPPVLVCHSMGGLAARAWLRSRPGAVLEVAHLVTIGTPHHGTWLARFSRRPNGLQMRLDSDWLRALEAHERWHPLPPTTAWYSNCDNVVFPPVTATLAAADNRFVPGRAHVALAFHPQVIDGTLALVDAAARRQGDFVTKSAVEIG